MLHLLGPPLSSGGVPFRDLQCATARKLSAPNWPRLVYLSLEQIRVNPLVPLFTEMPVFLDYSRIKQSRPRILFVSLCFRFSFVTVLHHLSISINLENATRFTFFEFTIRKEIFTARITLSSFACAHFFFKSLILRASLVPSLESIALELVIDGRGKKWRAWKVDLGGR